MEPLEEEVSTYMPGGAHGSARRLASSLGRPWLVSGPPMMCRVKKCVCVDGNGCSLSVTPMFLEVDIS